MHNITTSQHHKIKTRTTRSSRSDLVILCSRDFMNKGFTLLELLIVMGIIALLAGASLSSLTRSRTQSALRQGAQQIAQSLRVAEANALAVRVYGSVYPAYGVYFNAPTSNALTYQPFVDLDANGKYSNAPGDVPNGPELALPRGAMIKKIMYWDASGGVNSTTGYDLGVVFTRPAPTISYSSNNGVIANAAYAGVCVGTIDTSLTRIIKVWRTGHVSIGDFSTDCNEN